MRVNTQEIWHGCVRLTLTLTLSLRGRGNIMLPGGGMHEASL